MKVVLTFDLQAGTAEEAQKLLETLRDELGGKHRISDWRYEIETPQGPVTEKCLLAEGRVIA